MAHEPDGVIDYGATPYSTFTTGSTDQNINGVLIGRYWTDFQLTYSFPSISGDYSGSYPDNAPNTGFSSFSAKQEAAAVNWLNQYAAVSGLSFIELDGAPGALDEDQEATLRFANSTLPSTAYAYYPSSTESGGDMWFNGSGDDPDMGDYDWHTIGHELGHALGLSHGHTNDGGFGAMTASRDSMEFSIMTYRSYVGDPLIGGYSNEAFGYAQSLMMYDIAAIQFMYGANFGSNSSSTTYTFSTTTGQMFINGVGQGAPGANRIFRTIWDGNGSADHYDFSNYTTDTSIDLNPGSWVNLDRNGNFQRANLGDGNYSRGHIFNALQYNGDSRSLIERASGGSGSDYIYGNSANNVLWGNGDYDVLYGANGNDGLYGNNAADGGGATDTNFLSGGGGNDYFYGSDGNETMYGGSGSDIFYGNGGNDYIDGDTDNDTVSYYYATAAVVANLAAGTATGGDGTDTLVEIENLYGSNGYGDTLTGDDNANVIIGYGGNDTIYGAGGNDTLYGGNENDTIYAGSGTDTVYGGSGNDIIQRGGGGSLEDAYYGGSDTDTINTDTSGFVSGVVFDMTAGYMLLNGANYEIWNSFENYDGSDGTGQETVLGTSGNNSIQMGSGNNAVDGGAGSDVIYGGDGADLLEGGADNDSIYGGAGNDSLDGGIFGGASGSGNDFMQGGDGNDTVDGDDGNDTLYGNNSITGGGVSTETNSLYGDDGNDTLYGADGADTLYGGNDDDVLRGNGGNDALYGGAGKDRASYYYATAGVVVNLTAGTATGGDGSDTLFDIEDIEGSNSYGDTLTGNTSSNTIWGQGGNDVINGGGGVDTVYGGSGDDIITDANSGSGDTFDGGTGIDTLIADYTWVDAVLYDLNVGTMSYLGTIYDTITGIENLTIGGGADVNGDGNDNIITILDTGGSSNNTINAGGGADTVYAGIGNDIVDGEAGNDTIYGGEGNDTLYGGTGTDNVYGDGGDDVIAILGGDGLDNVYGGAGVDTLDYSDTFGTIVFNMNTNSFTFGGTARDAFDFENYSDSAGVGTINGTAAVNIIYGNAGNDTIQGRDGSDFLYGGDDNDTILAGRGGDTVDGGNGADTLEGFKGYDDMFGGSGNDSILGGKGNDTMTGDGGADAFYFLGWKNEGADTVTDFTNGVDNITIGGKVDFGDISILASGSDTLLSWRNTTVLLEGVNSGLIDAGDFIFV